MPRLILSLAFLIATIAVPLAAQTPKSPPPPKPDHGMVLSTAMEVAPGPLKDTIKRSETKNYVFRGKVITLNKERTLHLCYDTELMRVAGVWKGPYLNSWSDKNMGPTLEGTMFLSSNPGPGWAHDGKWDDPRDGGEGPLPREWAHFDGLFINGDAVVVKSTVNGVSILESFGATETNAGITLERRWKFGPFEKPLRVFMPNGGFDWVHGPSITMSPATIHGQKGMILEFEAMPKGGEASLKLAPSGIGKISLIPRFEKLMDFAEAQSHWKDVVTSKGELGKSEKAPYVQDAIGLPEKNPWNASVRFAGLDFFPDGRAALSTYDGDVWIVSGLDDKLGNVRWKRFAAGLQHPLGLKIVDGFIYTAGRDQITKLHDLNNDGEADYYENINNDPGLTLQRHEFVMGLETDAKGNFLYGRSGHYVASKTGANCVVYKMSPDGKKLDVFARGFREPNGVCVGPDGLVTLGDNEGNGIPQTPIYRVKEGGFYGYTPNPWGSAKEGGSWKETEKPIVWLPKTVDGSAASQMWTPSKGWGPLSGQLLHTSYGNSALFSLLIDKTAEPWQGAVWKFPMPFQTGLMRARFNPADGQLYVCGLRGWGTNGLKDGVFSRIRYTGHDSPVPVGFQVVNKGIQVTFSEPLDRKSAEDDQNWAGHWTANFTSKREDLPIESATLSADGKTATVVLEMIRTAVNFTLQYRVKSAAGPIVSGELNGTIHRFPK